MAADKCRCLEHGMRAQEAISEIVAEADMVEETGGSIKKRLEEGEQIAHLLKSLEDINRDCFALPPDLFRQARELRDYVEKTPVPFESDVRRDALDIERFLRSAVEDACK